MANSHLLKEWHKPAKTWKLIVYFPRVLLGNMCYPMAVCFEQIRSASAYYPPLHWIAPFSFILVAQPPTLFGVFFPLFSGQLIFFDFYVIGGIIHRAWVNSFLVDGPDSHLGPLRSGRRRDPNINNRRDQWISSFFCFKHLAVWSFGTGWSPRPSLRHGGGRAWRARLVPSVFLMAGSFTKRSWKFWAKNGSL